MFQSQITVEKSIRFLFGGQILAKTDRFRSVSSTPCGSYRHVPSYAQVGAGFTFQEIQRGRYIIGQKQP